MEKNKRGFVEFVKSYRTIIMIIAMVLLIIATICVCLYLIKNETKNNASIEKQITTELSDVKDMEKQTKVEAKIEIKSVIGELEKEGKETDFYMVLDKNDYPYIIKMTDKNYEKFNQIKVFSENVEASGVTDTIPDEIKQSAIEKYNGKYNAEYLSMDNFEQNIGTIYLNVKNIDN